jgi:Putative phage serine protease XkdF
MDKKRIVKCVIDENGKLGLTAMGLVDVPAIEETWIAMSSEKVKLSSVDKERRMLYGAALIPEKLILRIDKNNEEYYMKFERETIERLAHDFYKKNLHHTTNLQHQYPVTGVTIVESWLKEGNSDKSIALGLSDLPDGTWFIGAKVDDDTVWEEVKSGAIRGFSIEGMFTEQSVEMHAMNVESLLIKEIESVLASM